MILTHCDPVFQEVWSLLVLCRSCSVILSHVNQNTTMDRYYLCMNRNQTILSATLGEQNEPAFSCLIFILNCTWQAINGSQLHGSAFMEVRA